MDVGLTEHNKPLINSVAVHSEPVLATFNVTDSSFVHIGPKFIDVTQNLHNIEVTRGRILGLEIVSPENNKRRSRCCSTILFLITCCTMCAFVSFLTYLVITGSSTHLNLDIKEQWYVRRHTWHATEHNGREFLQLPVSKVIIGHSASESCIEKFDCIRVVWGIQKDHQTERRWDDIGPNFLVGGSGLVFEGRGANILGTMVKLMNKEIISIMFLGNYGIIHPTDDQFDNVNVLLQELVRKQVLMEDYVLYGHCQVVGDIVSPGKHLMDNLFRLDHWDSINATLCVRS